MTPQSRLAAIRERLSKATPGTWEEAGIALDDKNAIVDGVLGIRDGDECVIALADDKSDDQLQDGHDMEFIAHAGGTDGDLAWLLGIAEAAEKMADTIRAWEATRLRHGTEFQQLADDELIIALSAYDTAKGKDNG